MATVRMKKLLLIAAMEDKKQIYKQLHKLSCVEITDSVLCNNMSNVSNEDEIAELNVKLQKLSLIDLYYKEYQNDLKRIAKNNKIDFNFGKRGALDRVPSITFDNFYALSESSVDIFERIEKFEAVYKRIINLKAKEVKNKNTIQQLSQYAVVDEPVSLFRDTALVSAFLGAMSNAKYNEFIKIAENDFDSLIVKAYSSTQSTILAVVCLKEDKERIMQTLSAYEFSQANFHFKGNVASKIDELVKENIEIQKEKEEVFVELMAFEDLAEPCRLYRDYYNLQLESLKLGQLAASTKETVLIEAFYPINMSRKLEEKLSQTSTPLYFELRDVKDDENPPTLLKNNRLIKPIEGITNMLSAPAYGEFDPTAIVSLFFIIMAGIMMADFVYGILMFLVSGFVIYKKRPKPGKMSLVKLVCLIGLSAAFWGVMFGTYIGMSSTQGEFFKAFIPKAVLFDTLENPLSMLGLGLGLGLIHLMLGITINVIKLIKAKKIFAGLVHAVAWYFLVIGILLLGVKMIVNLITPEMWPKPQVTSYPTAGKILLLIALVCLAIDGTIGKKGAKKISGAVSGLYGVINFFADLLSYSRLFGLGLASAVVGYVFNQIAAVLISLVPYVGYILAGAFALVGHLFNIAINTLGAYVHGARLQFVEFFGKFHDGGGRLFKPLGSEIKYYEIEEI